MPASVGAGSGVGTMPGERWGGGLAVGWSPRSRVAATSPGAPAASGVAWLVVRGGVLWGWVGGCLALVRRPAARPPVDRALQSRAHAAARRAAFAALGQSLAAVDAQRAAARRASRRLGLRPDAASLWAAAAVSHRAPSPSGSLGRSRGTDAARPVLAGDLPVRRPRVLLADQAPPPDDDECLRDLRLAVDAHLRAIRRHVRDL